MTDSKKLIQIADWFDMEQESGRWGSDNSTEVQDDLRRIAKSLEAFGGFMPNFDINANKINESTEER